MIFYTKNYFNMRIKIEKDDRRNVRREKK